MDGQLMNSDSKWLVEIIIPFFQYSIYFEPIANLTGMLTGHHVDVYSTGAVFLYYRL